MKHPIVENGLITETGPIAESEPIAEPGPGYLTPKRPRTTEAIPSGVPMSL